MMDILEGLNAKAGWAFDLSYKSIFDNFDFGDSVNKIFFTIKSTPLRKPKKID